MEFNHEIFNQIHALYVLDYNFYALGLFMDTFFFQMHQNIYILITDDSIN